MATIKIKLRTSKVKITEGVVYYQICHKQKVIHITTDIHLSISSFESLMNARTVTDVRPSLRQMKNSIDYDLAKLQSLIASFEHQMKPYTCYDIKSVFLGNSCKIFFLHYMEDIIVSMNNNGKFGSARNYRSTLRSFKSFLQVDDIDIHEINSSLIYKYNEWLETKQVCPNTISFYMRNLRSVFNRAVKQFLVDQNNPFGDVYTGVDKTEKRAIYEDDLYKILQLKLKDHSILDFARDIFLFSFCTRGMSFVDISFLKKENVSKHFIRYRRTKTGQVLCVKIEPCIEKILTKYKEITSKSEFVFPILHSSDKSENYRRYHIALVDYNRNLKKLAELAKLDTNLSSYSARHTWATVAHYHNIPLSVISEGMGHTSESTTKIYLASLQNSVIDQANSSLLAHLNKLISL